MGWTNEGRLTEGVGLTYIRDRLVEQRIVVSHSRVRHVKQRVGPVDSKGRLTVEGVGPPYSSKTR